MKTSVDTCALCNSGYTDDAVHTIKKRRAPKRISYMKIGQRHIWTNDHVCRIGKKVRRYLIIEGIMRPKEDRYLRNVWHEFYEKADRHK